MTENDKLRDYDEVKHNAMPEIPIDGSAGNAIKTYDAIMRSAMSSVTIPGLADIASKYTRSMLAPGTDTAMQALVGQYRGAMASIVDTILPSITANLTGPRSIISESLAKSLAPTQSIISASLAKSLTGPQSSVASMLTEMDSVVKSVENSQRQIFKNTALMGALKAPVWEPPLSPSPALIKAMTIPVRVDPTPGLIRENLEVMREMLEANKTLLKRDEEREAAKVIAEARARRKDTVILWLTVALVVIGAITIFEILPN